jgi:two-component system alkaline phosphatase synthesis response regulator PhoP
MTTKQRILVVDDDREIVRLLRGYLEQAGYEVLAAYNGESAMQMVRAEPPDLLILDLMLPDRDGWEITRTIRADQILAQLPILMLTARVDDVDKILGLELGADDYVTKPFNPREVVARVRALLRRSGSGPRPASALLEVHELQLDNRRREVRVSGETVELTPTEFDLLRTLLESPGYVFTRDELVEKGLGYAYSGIGRTLDTHIKNLRYKIEPDPREPSYIQTVYGVGYRMAEASDFDVENRDE